MPELIQQGYANPQEIISQGFLSGSSPTPPRESIFTGGWGLSQILMTQGYSGSAPVVTLPLIIVRVSAGADSVSISTSADGVSITSGTA